MVVDTHGSRRQTLQYLLEFLGEQVETCDFDDLPATLRRETFRAVILAPTGPQLSNLADFFNQHFYQSKPECKYWK